MPGFDASSSECYSGPVDLRIDAGAVAEPAAVVQVEERVRVFVAAIEAGYFFPGNRTGASLRADAVRASDGVVEARFDVAELAVTALHVLGGMLADLGTQSTPCRSARAELSGIVIDLLQANRHRPSAAPLPPFEFDLPGDLSGNETLLVEIGFADAIDPAVGRGLLEVLALWDHLCLGYALDPDEPVEVVGSQRHFNDSRTIHHHAWVWVNVGGSAWNLLINLCYAWGRTVPVVRLHVE